MDTGSVLDLMTAPGTGNVDTVGLRNLDILNIVSKNQYVRPSGISLCRNTASLN